MYNNHLCVIPHPGKMRGVLMPTVPMKKMAIPLSLSVPNHHPWWHYRQCPKPKAYAYWGCSYWGISGTCAVACRSSLILDFHRGNLPARNFTVQIPHFCADTTCSCRGFCCIYLPAVIKMEYKIGKYICISITVNEPLWHCLDIKSSSLRNAKNLLDWRQDWRRIECYDT